MKNLVRKLGVVGAMSLPINEAKADLYDDFSSGTLNYSLWTESTIPANIHGSYPLFEEHFVNPATGKYQVSQSEPGNRSIMLSPTRQFNAGEILDYDIAQVSGEGNRLSHLYVDNSLPVYQNPVNFLAGPGIGYWNDIPDTGNQVGNYHARLVFNQDSIDLDFTRPDGTHYINKIVSSFSPHSISFGTYTGHNGTCRFDFDNFYISQVPENSTLALLGLTTLVALGRRKR